jgi:pilus assembly protein Flp/PilA
LTALAPPWHANCERKNIRAQWRRSNEKALRRFLADETGATAIEYGLIAAGISLAIIGVVDGLGTKLNSKFAAINNSLR